MPDDRERFARIDQDQRFASGFGPSSWDTPAQPTHPASFPGASHLMPPARTGGLPSTPTSLPATTGLPEGRKSPFAAPKAVDAALPVDDFDTMVGDLRRTFVGWLKKTEAHLERRKEELERDRATFEQEKQRMWKTFQAEKQREMDKLKDDRKKAEIDQAAALKQIQVEREDARRKIEQERSKMEQEKEATRRKFLLDREKFRQEVESFETERKRIVDHSLATETMVDLNVGGVVFETSRQTLTQQPGSFLEALLSGRHPVGRDRQGRLFLDRDSENFRTILNFLRNPQAPPMPRDAAQSEALCKEADFYGVRFFPFPLVFAVGGHSGYEHVRTVEVLDVGSSCWRPCRPMNSDRTYFGSAVLGKRLHVFGGQNLDYKALCEMEVYDCLRDTWMLSSSLHLPRRNCTGCELDNRIFAIGGFDGTNIISAVEAYDARMKNWMIVAPLTTPRSSAMASCEDGKIFVLGGTSGSRLRTVEFYEPRMNTWESFRADTIEVRSAGTSAACVNHLFVVGGTDNSNAIHYSVEALDLESCAWTFRKNMTTSRMDHG